MSRFSEPLVVGQGYDRKTLAKLWGLGGFEALGRGVFTPKGTNEIFLFVTRERLGWMTPYKNFLDGDLLFWDGEKGHRSDERIANASGNGESIHLFYRDNRTMPFTYYAKVLLVRFDRFKDQPSEFVFNVLAVALQIETPTSAIRLEEEQADYAVLS